MALKQAVISVLFFFSGLTSLIYEIVWQKRIMTELGSDIYATSMTLSAFMLGLALGGFTAGRFADTVKRRVLAYGALELLIGVYAINFPKLLAVSETFLKGFYLDYFLSEPILYWSVKFGLIFMILVAPSTLMGATLPLVVAEFTERDNKVGSAVSLYYSLNTIGAFFGVLLSGFVLIYAFGLSTTTWIAASFNFSIAAAALWIGSQSMQSAVAPRENAPGAAVGAAVYTPRTATIAITTIFIVGFCVLAMEVVWTRMLVQYFSATVYSFSIMLLFVLVGIWGGARKIRAHADSAVDLFAQYTNAITGMGVYVAFTALLFYAFPNVYLNLVFIMTGVMKKSPEYWMAITTIGKTVTAGFFIFVPCYLSGMVFPMAVRLYTDSARHVGGSTSSIYVSNTIGSVLGPLVASFILAPALGIRGSMLFMAFILVATGALAFFARKKSLEKVQGAAIFATALIMVVVPFIPKGIIANYTKASGDTEVVYSREGIYQTITILKSAKGHTIFMIDGNVEADNSYLQLRHFVLKSHFATLIHHDPRNVLVIGLGLGLTTSYLSNYALVKNIDVVELSPEVALAHKHIGYVNGDVLNNKKVNLVVDDGRNYLSSSGKKYDVITIDPIHPRISGVGTLYTRQFYELVKDRLSDDGVFIQWMPSYHMAPGSFKTAANTFVNVFDSAVFLYVKGHFLLVSKKGKWGIDYKSVRDNFHLAAKDLELINVHSPEEMISLVAMTPDMTHKYLDGFERVNTDDNLWLEYHVPGDYLYDVKSVVEPAFRFWGLNPEFIRNASKAELGAIMQAWRKRRSQVLPELEKPEK